jgi:chitinase
MTREGRGWTTARPRSSRRRRRLLLAIPLIAAVTVAVLVVWRPGSTGPQNQSHPPSFSHHPNSLPPRVLSGYWQAWGSPNIALGRVPAQYNVIYAAFAVADGAGTGRVKFDQRVQTNSSFVADLDALQRAGRRVVLSVGGADDGGLQIRTPAQVSAFLASVSGIIDRYHFTGVDWDLEHGIDRPAIAGLSRALKARYGARFLITLAPMQNQPDYEALAVDIGDVLDLVNPQFYNSGTLSQEYIVEQVRRWAGRIGPDRVGMGFMTVQTPGETGVVAPAAAAATWQEVVRLLPDARGLMTWSINLDATSGFDFAGTCGPLVGTAPKETGAPFERAGERLGAPGRLGPGSS